MHSFVHRVAEKREALEQSMWPTQTEPTAAAAAEVDSSSDDEEGEEEEEEVAAVEMPGLFSRHQSAQNVELQFRHCLRRIMAEPLSRLRHACGDHEMEDGWQRCLADMAAWDTASVELDVDGMRQQSTHIDVYAQKAYEAFLEESFGEMDDTGRPELSVIFVEYIHAIVRAPVLNSYKRYCTVDDSPEALSAASREALTMAFDACASRYAFPVNPKAGEEASPTEDGERQKQEEEEDEAIVVDLSANGGGDATAAADEVPPGADAATPVE